MNKNDMQQILDFIHFAEGLKKELRHAWLSDGRQESNAEHSWRLAFMAMVIAPELEEKIDLEKVLKICVVHDLVEAITHDIPAFQLKEWSKKGKAERDAMDRIKKMAPNNSGLIIESLWQEYREVKTYEAKFVKALDKLECRIQHNESDLTTWNDVEYPRSQFAADKYCQFSEFIREFNELVKEEAKDKIIKAGKDFNLIKKQAEELSGK